MKQEWSRDALVDVFRKHADEAEAELMSAYMRNHFLFLGIRSPLRKQLLRELFANYKLPEGEALIFEVTAIYDMPEREFQYAALAILEKQKKHLKTSDLKLCERLIMKKSWWDSIDIIAPKIVGPIVLRDRRVGEDVMRQWSSSDNMWLNRAAILHQLKYKTEMNDELLREIICMHTGSNEFFIQKAIGWVLREYAKTNPESVRLFVEATDLKPLSRREALKNLLKKF